jgi:hypothetical protein
MVILDGYYTTLKLTHKTINTLTTTDISTGWTECVAILHRSQHLVFAAIQTMRQRLPFPLLGLDSDNGGEFNDCLHDEISLVECHRLLFY